MENQQHQKMGNEMEFRAQSPGQSRITCKRTQEILFVIREFPKMGDPNIAAEIVGSLL